MLRRAFWMWLGANWRRIAAATTLILGSLIVVHVFVARSAYVRGAFDAAGIVGWLWTVTLSFLLTSGAVYQLAGAWGEDNTREELRRARRRGLIWGFVDGIEASGVDVDHLVLAPGGALALDSKWHFGELQWEALRRDVDAARGRAGTARSVLRSVHVDRPMDVVPVVVIWGRAQRDLPDEGLEREGVHVVAGADLLRWLGGWRTGKLPQDYAADVLQRLTQFADTRRGSQALPAERPAGAGLRKSPAPRW
ncbi:MAG TPA: hypothetical protein VFJ17_09125 [Mycobacteriales bacterium]|jgi:hypothetical protein|nr:hypothetical protein [Mycobacteriales bacterium]